MYNQAYKGFLSSKTGIHSVQSHSGNNRGTIRATKGTSREELYHALDFESLESRR